MQINQSAFFSFFKKKRKSPSGDNAGGSLNVMLKKGGANINIKLLAGSKCNFKSAFMIN